MTRQLASWTPSPFLPNQSHKGANWSILVTSWLGLSVQSFSEFLADRSQIDRCCVLGGVCKGLLSFRALLSIFILLSLTFEFCFLHLALWVPYFRGRLGSCPVSTQRFDFGCVLKNRRRKWMTSIYLEKKGYLNSTHAWMIISYFCLVPFPSNK